MYKRQDLPASIISRLPVRYTYDNRYFNDTHEGLPVDGYTAWLERMADHPNIDVRLDTDFFDDSQEFSKSNVVGPVSYTHLDVYKRQCPFCATKRTTCVEWPST